MILIITNYSTIVISLLLLYNINYDYDINWFCYTQISGSHLDIEFIHKDRGWGIVCLKLTCQLYILIILMDVNVDT